MNQVYCTIIVSTPARSYIIYIGAVHLGKDSFEKKIVVNFHNFGPDPPPKSCENPIFFLTPWPKKHFVQIKKNSPLKTQNT